MVLPQHFHKRGLCFKTTASYKELEKYTQRSKDPRGGIEGGGEEGINEGRKRGRETQPLPAGK